MTTPLSPVRRTRSGAFAGGASWLLAALALLATARPIAAQIVWTVTDLSPSGSLASEVKALDGARAGGDFVNDGDPLSAAVWTNGTPAALPSGGANASVNALSGTTAAGWVEGPDDIQAAVWNAGVLTNLNPSGAGYSVVRAISGNQLGGSAYLGGPGEQAVVWTGTSADAQSIQPTGAALSAVNAMSGSQLAGSARFGGSDHAVLWATAGNTVTDLNPGGATSSNVLAMTATQQGGSIVTGGQSRATLWSGTAGSAVDLNGSLGYSEIYAMVDGFQAGTSDFGATLWQGSADSYLNLDAVISGTFGSDHNASAVTAISIENGILYLGGYVTDLSDNPSAFVMSTPLSSFSAVPEPSTYAVFTALAVLGGAIWRRRAGAIGRSPAGARSRQEVGRV